MAAELPDDILAQLRAAKRLPSPPGTALRVLELTRRPDIEVNEIGDVIMSDPALAGRLLKFANSSVVGAGKHVTSVREAVLLLGLRSVKLTVLGFALVSPDFQARCPGFELKTFWSESFLTAVLARHLVTRLNAGDREEAFTVGLLAGIGRLALACGTPDRYAEVVAAADGGTPIREAERRLLGFDHLEFGAKLLAHWELPDLLVGAVTHHDAVEEAPEKVRPLARILHLALTLAPAFGPPQHVDADVRTAARETIEQTLKLDEDGWNACAEQILEETAEVAGFFDVGLSSHAAVLDLYAEAQEETTRVGIVAELESAQTEAQNKELLRKASTDGLTGVANRARFDDRLAELLKGLARGHGDFSLMIFDVDHFKKFNDEHGHQVGDLVLQRLARAVANTLRETDLLARYGGEEFAILSTHVDRRDACLVGARVHRCVKKLAIPTADQTLGVTISLGIAHTGDYARPPDASRLIADADKQLYLCKQKGRDTWAYGGRAAAELQPAGAGHLA